MAMARVGVATTKMFSFLGEAKLGWRGFSKVAEREMGNIKKGGGWRMAEGGGGGGKGEEWEEAAVAAGVGVAAAGSWVPDPRTGIYFPEGHDRVMEDVPEGAACFEQSHWFRTVDGVDNPHHDLSTHYHYY